MSKPYYAVVSLLALLVCIISLYSFDFFEKQKHPTSVLTAEEARWQNTIQKYGGVEAYELLKKEITRSDPSVQHNAAHAFGGALFATVGLSGISVCDTYFGYGCYHQFVGSAIGSLGLAVLPKLNESCLASPQASGCQHGIGHGLIAYLGYQENNLTQASAECAALIKSNSIDGCTGGVFMEYNLRTMLGVDARSRIAPEGEFTSLCKKFTGIAQQSCVLYLPQWWFTILPKSNQSATFAKMGSVCDSFNEKNLVRLCYEGIGQMAPPGGAYTAAGSATVCDTASSDKTNRLFCKAYAANIFLGTGHPDEAKAVCKGISGAAQVYCLTYATGGASLQSELPEPVLL